MMQMISLESIRNCLEGLVPSGVATCGADGMPNVTLVSQTMYVDSHHIALSFQFFNKTRENILVNPIASVLMMDPDTAARYRLMVHYLRTETSGPLFERMRAKLAGIATHEGVEDVFKLKGADVYRVLNIEHVPGRELPSTQYGAPILPSMRRCIDSLGQYGSLDGLVDKLLDSLDRYFDIRHSMFLMADVPENKLYTLCSRGYATSGVGAEIPFGVGVIGVAARECVPIRILFAASEYQYTRAMHSEAIKQGLSSGLEAEIPFPGLTSPGSQMAVPVMSNGRLLAVLYVESPLPNQFGYDMEDALVALCAKLGESMQLLQLQAQQSYSTKTNQPTAPPCSNLAEGPSLKVKYFSRDHSLFLDEEYLIKGVAGAILWYLLNIIQKEGRCEFSNRELRLEGQLPLPDIADNLDARLLLLSRRLQERSDCLAIEKSGRGRFKLLLQRPLELVKD
ncbi:GAF domain-containing protein [Bowmanella sp. Y26]|uniref:GAF domain-containing protein n=1 Tax=Bowmanella yangjiangensis TaxID=2811230 RepID=UPI001BDC2875|nr:GAF domain-containing protein [Bowmanella yangjiangensis]MBT1062371.1 GAF domain-containing protein [Bowmanella yangjiangensis]